MFVVIRADASSRLGIGHVMRCLTLADALRTRGASVAFVSAELDGHGCDLIARRGFDVARLPAADAACDGEWRADAAWTREWLAARGTPPEWLVVDHYGLGAEWERELRAAASRLFVIDDLAGREHDCDVLLDQNLVDGFEDRYRGRVPAGATTLLGPAWALLQPAYAELRATTPARAGRVRRILVFFSGADTLDLTGRTVRALLDLCPDDVFVDVVLARATPAGEATRAAIATRANFALHESLPSLAPLQARADVAIGAGGATSWERLCLGLPALIVTLADNQRPIAAALHARGLVRWLGDADQLDDGKLRAELATLLAEPLDPAWSLRCAAVVDGLGARRVSALLAASARLPLRARRVRADDERLLLDWANDPVTRRSGFSTWTIGPEEHRAWLSAKLSDARDCAFYIVETADEGLPVGQVRFQRSGLDWEVHYSVGPALRGRGMARPLLLAGIAALTAEIGAVSVFGKVKKDNGASRRVFESLEFNVEDAAADVLVFRRAAGAGVATGAGLQ